MPSFARAWVAVAAYILLLIATAWLLVQLAQQQFTAHLRDQAAHALVLAATGDTPYRWQLQSPDDIVAGRVFGAGEYRFSERELVVHSSGTPFEIGLPLARTLDLRRFPHLQIVLSAEALADLQVVLREKLDAPELISASTLLQPGENTIALDLAALDW